MSRLRHTNSGYLRLMQMSSTILYIFVEGKQADSYFYAKVCASTPNFPAQYEIHLAQQLPGETGGKKSILKFFTYVRGRNALVSSFGGQKTTCIFFLDKDVDDLRRRKKRSPHVIYTEHYDVQNYIFNHGDLVNGVAAAASIDPEVLNGQLNDALSWCLGVARLWREWVSLCVSMMEDGISCEATYSVNSKIQTRPYGSTDSNLYASLTRALARRNGMPVATLRHRLALTLGKVDRYYSTGKHQRIFKGKWFAAILADQVAVIMTGKVFDSSGLGQRLPSTIAATLDFDEEWADYYRSAIGKVIDLL